MQIVIIVVDTVISIHALLAESDIDDLEPSNTRKLFLSTLSLRRATRKVLWYPGHCVFLSTLSLRRATVFLFDTQQRHLAFLSTLSLRRATLGNVVAGLHMLNFYPRSPCGERQQKSGLSLLK